MIDSSSVIDLLHTLAEVSVAFVGFSTVVAALRMRDNNKYRIYSIRDVAVVGLVALAGSVMPLVIFTFTADQAMVWRIASFAFSVLWIGSAYMGIRSYNTAVAPQHRPKVLFVGPIAGLIANPLLWWNVVSPQDYAGSLYVLAVLLLLVFAAVSFVAASFLPDTEAE